MGLRIGLPVPFLVIAVVISAAAVETDSDSGLRTA
jgi:hypothetical protein